MSYFVILYVYIYIYIYAYGCPEAPSQNTTISANSERTHLEIINKFATSFKPTLHYAIMDRTGLCCLHMMSITVLQHSESVLMHKCANLHASIRFSKIIPPNKASAAEGFLLPFYIIAFAGQDFARGSGYLGQGT